MCFLGGCFTIRCKYNRYYLDDKILSHKINYGNKVYNVDIFIIVI